MSECNTIAQMRTNCKKPHNIIMVKLVDIVKLSELLDVSPATIRKLVRLGLPCYRVGVSHSGILKGVNLRFDYKSVVDWLEKHSQKGGEQ